MQCDVEPVTVNHLENLFVLMLPLKVVATEGHGFWHRGELLERAKRKELSERERKKQHGIGEEKNGEDDNKENSTEDGDFLIEGVAQEMKHDEERCHEETHEKNGVENAKDKLHTKCFLCFLDLSIVSPDTDAYNNLS